MYKKILISLLMFHFGCEVQSDVNKIKNLELNLFDSLYIETDSSVLSAYHIQRILNDTLLYGFSPFNELNTLSIFNLKNEKFLKKIKIDENLFKVDIDSFHVHNIDSIFFYSYMSKVIYLIDYKGNQINQWDLKNASGSNYPGENGFWLASFPGNNFSYNKKNNLLIIPIADNRFPEEKGNSNLPKLLTFNIVSGKTEKFLAPPTGRMQSRGDFSFPRDMVYPQFEHVDEKIYLTYPFDDEVSVYDLISGKLIKSQNPLKNEKLPLNAPKDAEFMSDRVKSWNFRVEMPYFENLSFHESLGIFSRIYYFPYNKESDPENKYLRKSCIVYFDKDLNFINKTNFQEGQIGSYRNAKLSDGYLIGKSDFFQSSEDILTHRFIYKFQ